MKPNQLYTSLLAVTALLVASCSTSKLANNTVQDDVYNTTAQAKEYKPAPPVQNEVTTAYNDEPVDEYYGKSDPYYDMDYSSRIDRFYYGNQNRGYYDPYYNYYGYNSFYSPYNNFYGGYFGGGLGFYYNSWYNNPFNNWGFYYGGYPYNNYWGPYSWGGGYGGGYYGGGFYGGGYYAGSGRNNNNRVYRSAPGAVDNRMPRNGTGISSPTYGRPARTGNVDQSGNRGYNPSTTASRPTRNGNNTTQPARNNIPTRNTVNPPQQQPARTESSRPTYSPPPASSGSSGSSSSGGTYNGGSRGSRGGRG